LEPSRSPTPTEKEEPVIVSPNFSLYTAYARQICQHIRELADLVLERRKSYLLTSVNVYGHANFMTDDDRQQFDSDTGLSLIKVIENVEFRFGYEAMLAPGPEFGFPIRQRQNIAFRRRISTLESNHFVVECLLEGCMQDCDRIARRSFEEDTIFE
jgi:hypothetical protein